MCGIAGYRGIQFDAESAAEKVAAMTAAVAHRGPDDGGVEVISGRGEVERGSGNDEERGEGLGREGGRQQAGSREPGAGGGPVVVFGHRRLAILDLSPAGHQPMRDPTTGNWITYNGEIYNFRELRTELAGRGHRFVSQCDTEVILRAYAEWGGGCWRRLRGIFAFGLWDAHYRELHLVRDHLGVKPLYFTRNSRRLFFASEVRAILATGAVERKLSPDGLRSYLKYGSVQEPATMVDGVESLGPGTYLTCEESGAITVRHFWRADEAIARNWEKQPEAGDVLGHLQDSVGRQLMADVPVGVFLSGGIDSTTLAALAARAQPGAVRTFCIGTGEKESDETAEAAATAAALGCEHASLLIEGRFVSERLGQALRSYDQPSHDGINTYFISLLVRQAGIKVALSGLGGDELFVGYGGFSKGLKFERAGRMLQRLPDGLRAWLARAIAASTPPGTAVEGALTEILSPDLAAPYFASRLLFCRRRAETLLDRAWRQTGERSKWQERERALARAARGLAPIDRTSFFELQTYMVSTLLRDADQMSMAHGLELRVPLIDPVVVEHVLPIATEDKVREGTNKRLLLEALRGIVPPEVFARRKRGFVLPFRRWLLQDLQAAAEACFLGAAPRGPWDLVQFRRVWSNFRKGRVSWSRVLVLFILENWMEQNGISA